MKTILKKGISVAVLALGITSLTGCFYYHHDSDYAYHDRDWGYYDRDGRWHDRDWNDRYTYSGPRHHDWNYD